MRLWPRDLREQVESSWQAIFDPRHWTKDSILQATMHEIRAEDVVDIIRLR